MKRKVIHLLIVLLICLSFAGAPIHPKIARADTTVTFVPNDDTVDKTDWDGYVRRNGMDETWGTIRTGEGNGYVTGANYNQVGWSCSNTTNQYSVILVVLS